MKEQQYHNTYCQYGPPEEEGEGQHSNYSSDDNSLPRAAKQCFPWLPLLWQQRNHLKHTKRHVYIEKIITIKR